MMAYLPMLPKGEMVQQQTEKFHLSWNGTKSQNANSTSQLNKTE